MPYDNVRALCGRRKENKKEELPEDQTSPYSQMLQKGQGAQTTDDKTKETGGDKAAEEGPPPGKTEPRKDAKRCPCSPRPLGTDWKLPVPLGTVYPPLLSSLSSTKAVGRSWELSPPTANSFRIHDVHVAHPPQKGPFRHFMDMKAEKRLAGRKEHRSCFGDINVHKCSQFGQIFCPFQALATTEMQRLVFPKDLPVSPHMQRLGVSCTTEGNLQDLSLSSTELGLGKDTNNQEKEKPSSHMKTPLFPPIVKATKSNDMK
ncbi:uncharacterized protein LOC103007299 [Balaenoptera acutorostrata]|uniref:Uncharacterized protein LOC103007299 n=1 Tax=Balaenoptera acutorostrata TaxID=9767 RepID=A0A452CJG8_BALAC|nr:uncharacterized protein LOC103007299 [Balaenoptera acutorostrata]